MSQLVAERTPVLADQLHDPEGRIRWDVARAIGRLALEVTDLTLHAERCLADVDNLKAHRRPDGTHPQHILNDTEKNLRTRVTEPAMPHAVSTTYQSFEEGQFRWLNQSALQVAASGYRYHFYEAGLQRVDVEVVEALYTQDLPPNQVGVLFSSRISKKDATKEIAEHEHLADDDSIRIQWIDYDVNGNMCGKYVQSILIRSDLRKAWVAMLADPDNIFGKSIAVEDPDSALSLMKAFPAMQIDRDKLPEGVVTLLEATIPYIENPQQRREVMHELLPEYRKNQQRMRDVAQDIAKRWLTFEIALSSSLATGFAEQEMLDLMHDVGQQWADDDADLFARHQIEPGKFRMSRELAVRLEQAQESILCAQAALLIGNRQITKQIDPEQAAQIITDVQAMHDLMRKGGDPGLVAQLRQRTTNTTAVADLETGGGCPGKLKGNFRKKTDGSIDGDPALSDNENDTSEEESEACDYDITCYCSPYNNDATPRKSEEVPARREANGMARCMRDGYGCGAKINEEGKVISKGRIYELAQQKRQEQSQMRRENVANKIQLVKHGKATVLNEIS